LPGDQLMPMLDEALEGYAELNELKGGARLRLVTTEEKIEGAPARLAELNAVEYVTASGKAHRVYLLTKEGKSGSSKKLGFWDAKGRQPYRGAWRSPLAMARVSSRFNPQRMHPVLHIVMPHTGVDFAAASGTPVYSCAPGVVRTAGDGGACGNMVQVQHANGLVSAYCHLSRFAPGLHAGQRIEARHLIGYVGQTGRATGPHLHFAVKRGETFIDPLSLKLDGFRLVPRQDKETFTELRAELDEALDSIPLPGGAPTPADDPDSPPDDNATDDH
jgi:murein DD-endopeptidase MepM/ murein hydrolase activator NlpD